MVMFVLNVAQLVENLAKSRILADVTLDVVREMARAHGEEASPADFARQLATEGFISQWQADELCQGRVAFDLGDFRLMQLLGVGGMGSVFKARHVRTDEIVALKVMAPAASSSKENVERFHREVKAAARLRHPNLVSAQGAHTVGNRVYMVMEYVPGRTLREIMDAEKKPLALPLACEWARQAAEGLEYAHSEGMVHRDIKPANLMITEPSDARGEVKILDLGVARFLRDNVPRLTVTGQLLGTPDYMSPEQAQAARNVDARADVYSLACTLYEMVTGKLPFGGKNMVERVMARMSQPPTPIQSHRADLPAPLAAGIMSALERDPQRRLQSCAALAALAGAYAAREMPA